MYSLENNNKMETRNPLKKIVLGVAAVGTALSIGLTSYDASAQNERMQRLFNDYANEAIGTTIREGIKGRLNPDSHETNFNINTNSRHTLPKNVVIKDDGKYYPAEGYKWASDDPKDKRVVRKNLEFNLNQKFL